MKSAILEIMQTALGLPNSPVAQVTVGARSMYADEFAARLAEELDDVGYAHQDEIFCDCDDDDPEPRCEHCKCDCAECEDCG